MQQMLLNETTAARRRIPMFFFDDDSADAYAPKTGLTFAAGELKVSKNGAAEANALGTVTELAGGGYYYEATAAEMDTMGFLQVRPVKTDVYGAPVVVQVIALNLYDAVAGGMTRLDATVSSRLPTTSYEGADAILDKANGVYTGFTMRQALRAMSALLHGKVSGARTGREIFRSVTDDSDAVTITNDSSGNRTAVVRNV
jgi:hypothetical protein